MVFGILKRISKDVEERSHGSTVRGLDPIYIFTIVYVVPPSNNSPRRLIEIIICDSTKYFGLPNRFHKTHIFPLIDSKLTGGRLALFNQVMPIQSLTFYLMMEINVYYFIQSVLILILSIIFSDVSKIDSNA